MSQSATPAASEHRGESALRRGDLSVLWATQWTMRMLLGGLFIFAAWNKLHPASSPQAMNGPQTFASSVQAFKLGLPDWAIRASVSVTPWLEVVSGLALILGVWRRGAALIMSVMLVGFILLIASVLWRNMSVECGCFGKLSPFCPKSVGWCNIAQNSVMLLVALFLTLTRPAPMRLAK